MIKGFLLGFVFALLFIIVGLVASAMLSPLFFPHADARKMGQVEFPFIVVLFGGGGFAFGRNLGRKK